MSRNPAIYSAALGGTQLPVVQPGEPREVRPLRGRQGRRAGGTELTDDVALSTLTFVLGVPPDDRKFFYDWANRIIGYHDETYNDPGDPAAVVDRRSPSELTDMIEYARSLAEYRRRNPADDLISVLVHTEVDGRGLTDAEFQNFSSCWPLRATTPHGAPCRVR